MFFLFLAGLLLAGCQADTSTSDTGVPGDTSDGALSDHAPDIRSDHLPGADPLAQVVRPLMTPYVDPASPDDLTTCIGAVVGVVTPHEQRVFGFGATRANGSQIPDGDTVFQIGSVSKVFTGLALARFIVDGPQAKPTDPVNDLLAPDIQAPAGITLGHLVSHYSGLPTFPTNMVDRDGDGKPDAGHDPLSPAADYSRKDLAQFLAGYTPPKKPGTTYLYSNVGIGLLGVALADALELSDYHALLQQQVTKDLGMTHTWGENTRLETDKQWLAKLAQGYAQSNASTGGKRIVGKRADMGVLAGGGEISTTANDMLIFLRALSGQSQTLLDEAIQLAIQPLAPATSGDMIGYALEIEASASGTLYKKAGSTSSYTSYLLFDRDRQLGVAVMVNVGGFKSVKEIAFSVHGELVKLGSGGS